jgi:hypothetical protein
MISLVMLDERVVSHFCSQRTQRTSIGVLGCAESWGGLNVVEKKVMLTQSCARRAAFARPSDRRSSPISSRNTRRPGYDPCRERGSDAFISKFLDVFCRAYYLACRPCRRSFYTSKEISAARGWDKLITLGCVFIAVPLAVFAPEHFGGPMGARIWSRPGCRRTCCGRILLDVRRSQQLAVLR